MRQRRRRNGHHRKNPKNRGYDYGRERFKGKDISKEQPEEDYEPKEPNKILIGASNTIKKIKFRYKLLFTFIIINIIYFSIVELSVFLVSLIIYVMIADVLFVILWIWGWTSNCPRCKSYFARQLIDRSHFGARTEYEEHRRDIIHVDRNGNEVGRSSIPVQKPVIVETIQNHWHCKYCDYNWSGRIHDVRR